MTRRGVYVIAASLGAIAGVVVKTWRRQHSGDVPH